MPSLIDIRRRIRSVKNTQQITKAMKMMSAARLRRAQERVIAARPYSNLMRTMLNSLVTRLETARPEGDSGPLHPLLARRPVEKILLVVMGGDKGLAGAFNTNVHKAALSFLAEHAGKHVDMIAVGKKPRDFFRRRRTLAADWADVFSKVQYATAKEIAQQVASRYAEGSADAVYIIYNEFKSVINQKLNTDLVLPLGDVKATPGGEQVDYIYEQAPEVLLATLLPRYVEVQVYRYMLESAAAEHASRMTAMDKASKSAADMIDALTLNMNRIRQASITREIIEIVSGAAALG
jgi:F-type H+-transporting ATPase subunit gamma